MIHYPPLARGTYHAGDHTGTGGVKTEALDGMKGNEVDRSVQLSCGEHTDYGLLTLVNQQPDVTALQVSEESSSSGHKVLAVGLTLQGLGVFMSTLSGNAMGRKKILFEASSFVGYA